MRLCRLLGVSKEELGLVSGNECPVQLCGMDQPPLLYGRSAPGGPVTGPQYSLLEALVKAFPGAAHKDTLTDACSSYTRELTGLLEKRPIFKLIVHRPGRKGAGGYKLA